jgi:hypothetical protein
MVLPVHDDSELKSWVDKLSAWKSKAANWAKASGDAKAASLVAAMPEGPVVSQRKEDLAKPSPFDSPWIKVGVIGALLFGAGYLVSGVAKVVRG